MNEDTQNLITAVLLCATVMLLWNTFYAAPKREAISKYVAEKNKIDDNEQIIDKIPNTDIVVTPPSRTEVLADGDGVERIRIATDKLHGSINLTGGRIDDLTLATYHVDLDKNSPEVVLLSPKESKEVYFAEFGWISSDKVSLPDSKTVWKSNSSILTPNSPVVLTWDNGEGLRFKKTIGIDNEYMFSITETVENLGSDPVSVVPYGMINRSRDDQLSIYISHEGPLGVFDKILTESSYDDLKDDVEEEFKGVDGWLGIADKYWLTAIIPSKNDKFDAHFKYYNRQNLNRYQVDFIGSQKSVQPSKTITVTHNFFAGVKTIDLLDGYKESMDIPLFDRAVDFGKLYFLTKPMLKALKGFYGMLGNFGLAILLLTVIVKAVLFPLANKSYKSMAKMKKLMPEMRELQARYKDDKTKLNHEMMKFYKEKNVNPMAGCLPILVQIPIFFSLYKVLYVTIEMRHAPFFGWIHDLSARDTTNLFDLFGLIQWTPPSFLPMIGVLPILFALTMFIQQKFNPPPTDPTQAIVMKAMPVLFLFLFARFPAGLVVYWIWNNSLSILQQWIITRKINTEPNGHL